MKKYLVSCLFICLAVVACKKAKQQSVWKVNGEGFSTNEVEIVVGKAWSALSSTDNANGFSFGTMFFNRGGKYINCGPNPSNICAGIYYKGNTYNVKNTTPPAHMKISYIGKKGEKLSLSMTPTWFVNRIEPNDSVLVEGEFNEP